MRWTIDGTFSKARHPRRGHDRCLVLRCLCRHGVSQPGCCLFPGAWRTPLRSPELWCVLLAPRAVWLAFARVCVWQTCCRPGPARPGSAMEGGALTTSHAFVCLLAWPVQSRFVWSLPTCRCTLRSFLQPVDGVGRPGKISPWFACMHACRGCCCFLLFDFI